MMRRAIVAVLLSCAAAVFAHGLLEAVSISSMAFHEASLAAFVALVAAGIVFKTRPWTLAAASGLVSVATPASMNFDGAALYVFVLPFAALYAVSAAGSLRSRGLVSWKGFGVHTLVYLAAPFLTLVAIDRFGLMYEIMSGLWLSGLAALLHSKPPTRSR